ncbi:MAG: hypothetical protein WAW37_06925 [Syntrophobacteraceae bacterium]
MDQAGSEAAKAHYKELMAVEKQIFDRDNKEESGGGAKKALGIEQLRLQIHQVEENFRTMYREFHNEQYAFWEAEALSQGRFSDAATLKNSQALDNIAANIGQQTLRAMDEIQRLEDKLGEANKRGVNTKAGEALKEEIARKKEMVGLDGYRYEQAQKQFDLNQKMDALKTGVEVAQLNASYAQLTGTIRDQLAAQIELIDAQAREKGILDLTIPQLDAKKEGYRKLYLEQQRVAQVMKDGSFYDGMREGWAQLQRDMQTEAQLGAAAMKDIYKGLVSDISRGFGDLFGKFFRGEIKSAAEAWTAFCDVLTRAFSNAVSNMISKWIESQLSSLLMNAMPTATSFVNWSSGSYGYGATGEVGAIPVDHMGGIIGVTPPFETRMVDLSMFSGARRFHSGGLASDEVPAILQKGELVIRKGGWRADDSRGGSSGPPKVNITVNDQSGRLQVKEEEVSFDFANGVLSVVFSAIDSDTRMRDKIKGASR